MAGTSQVRGGSGGRPVLASKLRRPIPRPGTVARDRLAGRLHDGSRPALTLVSAPAGFGKTTLVAQWLDGQDGAAALHAWVSLDARDNDPVTFWTYVAAAVRRAVDPSDAITRIESRRQNADDVIAELLNDLEAMTTEFVVVLDDYHVIDETAIHDGMTYVLDHLPPACHVIVATRVDPPLAIARLRARGQLLEVRAAALRFNDDETQAYLARTLGRALPAEQITILAERTEGWAAALQLAGLSMQTTDPDAFIAGFSGADRYVVDYLAAEVLAGQPPDVREFLLRTSVLERLTGPLCDAVTGSSGGRDRLLDLERRNLFLARLDDRGEWFRYHQLFSDVLQSHLLDEYPELVPQLHQRASKWFEGQQTPEGAITHALAAGELGRAADLMESAMPAMRRDRREAELAAWVRALPDDVLDVRPVLATALVGALAQVSEFAAVGPRLDRIEVALRRPDGSWPSDVPPGVHVVDVREYAALPATVAMYRSALSLSAGDIPATAAYAQEALALAPADGALVRAAAGALGGLAAWTVGDLEAALTAYTESAAGLRLLGFHSDVLGCTITIADLLRTLGRLDDALRAHEYARATAVDQNGAPLRGAADMHVGIAEILVERGDLAAATDHLVASERLGSRCALPQNPYRWCVVSAQLRAAQGDLDTALQLLDRAERVYAGDYSPKVRPVASVRARMHIRHGDLTRATAWAAAQGLAASDPATYLREHEHLTFARLLIARMSADTEADAAVGGVDTAAAVADLLARLLTAADRGARRGSVVEILMLQAIAYSASGDDERALGCLERAVGLAAPQRYVRLFADEGPRLARLLKRLSGNGPTRAYVRMLLAATARTPQPIAADQGGLMERLSERELEVLRLLPSDLAGPDLARQLHVSLNTLRTHTRNIFRKLGVTSRRAAVRRAAELGLLATHRDS